MKRTWRFWFALWAGKFITKGLLVAGKKADNLTWENCSMV